MRGQLICCLLLFTTAGPATSPSTKPAPKAEIPTPDRPVTAAISIEPDAPRPDSDVELRILVRIAPGHWLYAHTDSKSPFTPIRFKIKSSPTVRETGAVEPPTPDSRGHFTGDVEFRQRLHLSPNITPGKHALTCELTYQACNPDLCWPPQTIQLKAEFEISAHPQNERNSR